MPSSREQRLPLPYVYRRNASYRRYRAEQTFHNFFSVWHVMLLASHQFLLSKAFNCWQYQTLPVDSGGRVTAPFASINPTSRWPGSADLRKRPLLLRASGHVKTTKRTKRPQPHLRLSAATENLRLESMSISRGVWSRVQPEAMRTIAIRARSEVHCALRRGLHTTTTETKALRCNQRARMMASSTLRLAPSRVKETTVCALRSGLIQKLVVDKGSPRLAAESKLWNAGPGSSNGRPNVRNTQRNTFAAPGTARPDRARLLFPLLKGQHLARDPGLNLLSLRRAKYFLGQRQMIHGCVMNFTSLEALLRTLRTTSQFPRRQAGTFPDSKFSLSF